MENNYTKQANDFLNACDASLDIAFRGKAINTDWKEDKPRNSYNITIKTKRGEMSFVFWDSLHNTEISEMTACKWFERTRNTRYQYATQYEKRKAAQELKEAKAEAIPNAYDVLACLTKYDPGTFEDFCSEFGYNEDSITAVRAYIAVVKEYKQLERIFAAEELEALQEIN